MSSASCHGTTCIPVTDLDHGQYWRQYILFGPEYNTTALRVQWIVSWRVRLNYPISRRAATDSMGRNRYPRVIGCEQPLICFIHTNAPLMHGNGRWQNKLLCSCYSPKHCLAFSLQRKNPAICFSLVPVNLTIRYCFHSSLTISPLLIWLQKTHWELNADSRTGF